MFVVNIIYNKRGVTMKLTKRREVIRNSPGGNEGRRTTYDRAIQLAGEVFFDPAKCLASGLSLYWNALTFRAPVLPQDSKIVFGTSVRNSKQKHAESISLNTQRLRIGKVATQATIKRNGSKDVVNVEFEDGSSLKVTLRAESIKKIYIWEGETKREINEQEAFEFIKNKEVSAFGSVPGCRKASAQGMNDRIVLQSSSGESLVLEVAPGSIYKVEHNY